MQCKECVTLRKRIQKLEGNIEKMTDLTPGYKKCHCEEPVLIVNNSGPKNAKLCCNCAGFK